MLLFRIIGQILEQVARRAVQDLTQAVEGGKANGAGLVGLEDRKVIYGEACCLGQVFELHPPV